MAALDIKLLYFFNHFAGTSVIFDGIIIFFASYLQYVLGILFLAVLYFWRISRSEKIKIFWITIISAAVARLGVTELIRHFYHRLRPFVVYGDIHKLISDNAYSFPSGHAAFFFAVAMAIYFYNRRWGAWFFIAVILISIGRVATGVHYPSDILGGAIIGIISAYGVYWFAEVRTKKKISN